MCRVGEVIDRLRVDTTASIWDPTGSARRAARVASAAPPCARAAKLPGTLVVDIDENLPVALVATSDGFKAYDARGVALPIDPARTPIDAPIAAAARHGVLAFLGLLRARHRRSTIA